MLVLAADDVVDLLELDSLIDALASAMADLSAGRASVPSRTSAVVHDMDGRRFAMPGYVPSQGALVTKLVSLFPGNAGPHCPGFSASTRGPERGARLAAEVAARPRLRRVPDGG